MEELDRRSTASLGTSDGPENHESTAKSNGSIAKAKPFFELSDDEEPSPVRRETPGSPSRANKKKIREPYGLQLQSCSSITPYGVEDILSAATKSPQNVTAAGSAISAIQAKNENRSSTRNEARPNTSPFVKAWDSFHLTPEISNPPDLKIEAQYQGKTDSEEKYEDFENDSLETQKSITKTKCFAAVPSFPTRGVAHTNKYRLKKVENALTDAAERRKILDELHNTKATQRQEVQHLRLLAQKKRREIVEQERQRKQKEYLIEMKLKEHEKNEGSKKPYGYLKKSKRPVTTIKASRSGMNTRTISLQNLGREVLFKCDNSISPPVDRIKSL